MHNMKGASVQMFPCILSTPTWQFETF